MVATTEAMRPVFLDHDVTDQELLVECMALAAGRYPGWHVQRVHDDLPHGEPSQGPETVRELWLDDAARRRQHAGCRPHHHRDHQNGSR